MGAPYGGTDPITNRLVGSTNERVMEYDDWLMWFLITYGTERASGDKLYQEGYPMSATDIGHLERNTEVYDTNIEVYYRLTDKGRRYLEMLENYDRLLSTSNERR